MKLKYIPNVLSFIRILLVGVFAYSYFKINIYFALAIFILAGATDVLDGILARKFNWITNLGKILDPIADKSMQITVLICMSLGDVHFIPWWFTAFFIIKESLMGLGALVVFKKRDTVVSSKWFGKLAVCVFYSSVFIIIVLQPSGKMVVALCLITIICALMAFISYVRNYTKKTIPQNKANSSEI
jgi:cardiolipin synthase